MNLQITFPSRDQHGERRTRLEFDLPETQEAVTLELEIDGSPPTPYQMVYTSGAPYVQGEHIIQGAFEATEPANYPIIKFIGKLDGRRATVYAWVNH